MRLGLLGLRADERGLARLTGGFHDALRPYRTLAIDMGTAGFPTDFSRYPDSTVIPFAGGRIEPDVLRRFLRGLDVCYFAETPYDYAAYDIARELRVKTVTTVMPEFYRHGLEPHLPAPDRVWAPTSWRLDTLPEGTPVIPVPVALDRFPGKPTVRLPGEPLRVLHVAGKMAALDRNGTRMFLNSLALLNSRVEVTVITQERQLPLRHRPRPNVKVTVTTGGVGDYPSLYAGQHVLVTPRRYGGLHLPGQEAMAAGLAVVMPDVSPNRDWPVVPVPVRRCGGMRTQGGMVPVHDVRPLDLAAIIDRLAGCEDERMSAAQASVDWAAEHSWDALLPTYRRELARA